MIYRIKQTRLQSLMYGVYAFHNGTAPRLLQRIAAIVHRICVS